MATDQLIAKGGKLSQLSDETVQALRNVLPPYCSTANPIDIFEEATPARFRDVMELCLERSKQQWFFTNLCASNSCRSFRL